MSEADAEFIEKVKGIITANMDSAELDVQYIAREMAMSHSTLYRKVKAVTGLTVNSLIRKCRAREAGRLLETGRYTVSEISYMVGISSPGNFRQCFKEEFGVNPSDYLKGKGRGQSV
jgi:AraC-like DNA-binding protein